MECERIKKNALSFIILLEQFTMCDTYFDESGMATVENSTPQPNICMTHLNVEWCIPSISILIVVWERKRMKKERDENRRREKERRFS